MAHFEDLQRCTYFPGNSAGILAIGWLERGHRFTEGTIAREFVVKLKDLLKNPWAPVVVMGPHFCDLCPSSKGVGGVANLFVPAPDAVFVAPELIAHYIEKHAYRPPDEFIDAVMLCPAMDSDGYHAAIGRHYRPFGAAGRP